MRLDVTPTPTASRGRAIVSRSALASRDIGFRSSLRTGPRRRRRGPPIESGAAAAAHFQTAGAAGSGSSGAPRGRGGDLDGVGPESTRSSATPYTRSRGRRQLRPGRVVSEPAWGLQNRQECPRRVRAGSGSGSGIERPRVVAAPRPRAGQRRCEGPRLPGQGPKTGGRGAERRIAGSRTHPRSVRSGVAVLLRRTDRRKLVRWRVRVDEPNRGTALRAARQTQAAASC